jgi:glycosyltransferase involved in cell wall biosynthesis
VRIALLTYSTRPRGGVVHTLALAEALAAAGEDVTVWTLGRGGDTGFFRAVDPRVRLRVVPFADREAEGTGPRIVRSVAVLATAFAAEAGGFDVVHAQDCISANAVLDVTGGACLRTVHHLDAFTTPELAACHERAIVEPRAHVCVSAAVARELADGWGRSATVIPNGVDAARFAAAAAPTPAARAARERWRERLGRYVLAVGGIEPRKGSLELLEAFAVLRRSRSQVQESHPHGLSGHEGGFPEPPGPTPPALRLVVAGGETLFDYRPYRARWEARAAELGVEPVVLGPVPDPDLPALVAAAEVFAFPSVTEGFGLAAMEALAAGVPTVVSDLPVLREVFAGAAAFAPSDTEGLAAELAGALERPDQSRVAAGRALAACYTWAEAARRHRELYRSFLADRGSGSEPVRVAR